MIQNTNTYIIYTARLINERVAVRITFDRWRHMFEAKVHYEASVDKGGAAVLKVGGGQFCEHSEPKKILTPPLLGQWGGQNIA